MALMGGMGLRSVHAKRSTRSLTDSRNVRREGHPNILRDERLPAEPRMGLSGGITYLKTGEGFVYYAVF